MDVMYGKDYWQYILLRYNQVILLPLQILQHQLVNLHFEGNL